MDNNIKKPDFFIPNVLDVSSAGSASSMPNASSEVKGEGFSDVLKKAISGVNEAQNEATVALDQALNGESNDVHETMIALQKADTSLKMMLEVRNKLLTAYQEVIKTQI